MSFRLKDFAFFYSPQVGVVVTSLLGMVIHTVALLKYFFNSVAETSPKDAVYQYVISLIFIVLGLVVYVLGLTGSALENSKILRVGGRLLVVETVYWIILMGISFSGQCQLIRKVCVDNRCPERLYVQNGYWRPTVQECNKSDNPLHNSTSYYDYEENEPDGTYFGRNDEEGLNDNTLEESNTTGTVNVMNSSVITRETDPIENLTSEASSPNFTSTAAINESRRGPDIDVHWTPIGELRSTPHFSLSVSYAVLIILIWYLYPIWLFFSFAAQIDYDEV